MKRILIIAGFLIAAVGIVVIGVVLRGGTGSGAPAGPAGTLPATGGTLPLAGTADPDKTGMGTLPVTGTATGTVNGVPVAGISLVSQAAVLDYAATDQGIFFIAMNGAVITVSSSEAIVGEANFGTLLDARFSPDGKWLLVKSGDSNLSRWSLLDVAKRTWKDIAVNTAEMVWSPSGDQLAYFARRTNGATLSLFNPATNAVKPILTSAAPDMVLHWKGSSHLLLMERPTSLVQGTIWDVAVGSGTVTAWARNISGAQLLWGGDISGGLLFQAGPTGGRLALVDAAGNTTQTANFLTLPSKCVFGESGGGSIRIPNAAGYLFCAIPQDANIMKRHQLPDDYLKGSFGTTDTFYAINTFDGTLTPVVSPAPSLIFDATNVAMNGDALYFINRNDRRIYRASLAALIPPAPAEWPGG